MEKTELLKLLNQAEQQIAQDTELIGRQRKMLADLDGKGVDNGSLQIMLNGLENMLIVHLEQREKLRAELAKLEQSNQGPQPSGRS